MRITLELKTADDFLILPVHYNYYIQSFLYHHISQELGEFLHDQGFILGKRRFKMFTFSRLYGRYRIVDKKIKFFSSVYLTVSSPLDRFVSELGNSLLRKDNLKLAGNIIHIESIRVHPEPDINDEIEIGMLSPVVVYSTLFTGDGKKKTYYYSPYEAEFSQLVDRNLRKKYEALYGKKPSGKKLELKTLGRVRNKILMYRGTVIKGWMGRFRLNGNKKLLKFAYDTGIGSKNSQGFGMFEVIE